MGFWPFGIWDRGLRIPFDHDCADGAWPQKGTKGAGLLRWRTLLDHGLPAVALSSYGRQARMGTDVLYRERRCRTSFFTGGRKGSQGVPDSLLPLRSSVEKRIRVLLEFGFATKRRLAIWDRGSRIAVFFGRGLPAVALSSYGRQARMGLGHKKAQKAQKEMPADRCRAYQPSPRLRPGPSVSRPRQSSAERRRVVATETLPRRRTLLEPLCGQKLLCCLRDLL